MRTRPRSQWKSRTSPLKTQKPAASRRLVWSHYCASWSHRLPWAPERRAEMDLGIAGKTALVHGAGGGLGGAIALALAQEGVNVAVCDVNADALTATVERIRSVGGSSYAQQWDLADIDGFAGRLE